MKVLSFFLVLITFSFYANAQRPQYVNADQIYTKIQKLNFLGTVLYIGAHPDDENTSMISYFSNAVHANVAYIAMTRGDGGQNLLGPEIRELLGVIRTQELLDARRIDGGKQFFTRANDFGFSKNPDETFTFWNKQQVLSDLVYVIRKFQPDVLINRFDYRTPGTTHGHHTASAILGYEAFDLVGDKTKFPEQLKYVSTWQPKRLFFNTSWWFYGSHEKYKEAMEKTDFFRLNDGTYFPLLGMSNTEISALSRSQHLSQGMGMMSSRGDQTEYLELLKGSFSKNAKSVFDGIDTTWNRVEGGAAIGAILSKVQANFDFKNPAASVPQLLQAYHLIQNLKDEHWRTLKTQQIQEIIADCLGLYLWANPSEQMTTPGATLQLNFEAINRSNAKVVLHNVNILPNNVLVTINKALEPNKDLKLTQDFSIPDTMQPTNPYWLNAPFTQGMYTVNDQKLIGLPETPNPFQVIYYLTIDGKPFEIQRPIAFRTSLPNVGELIKPFDIVPEATVAMHDKSVLFANDEPKEVKVDIKAFADNISGTVKLNHATDWKVEPAEFPISIAKKGDFQTVTFKVTPPKNENVSELKPEFISNGKSYTKTIHIIDYPHILEQVVLLPAHTKAIRLNVQLKGKKIAYIEGVGDEVPQSLREVGYEVTVLQPNEFTLKKLQAFDAVVVGIRAYDLDNGMVSHQNTLFDYVKAGGTVVNQYNTTRELRTQNVAPYPMKLSTKRVTDENSEVKFLAPNSPILNTPNKITAKDFEGWVQERGLYFPETWDKAFTPILGMHDKGEDELKGSLLVSKYGKGYFIYTGLSLFRELPAGVPGAFRLFANMLSIGK